MIDGREVLSIHKASAYFRVGHAKRLRADTGRKPHDAMKRHTRDYVDDCPVETLASYFQVATPFSTCLKEDKMGNTLSVELIGEIARWLPFRHRVRLGRLSVAFHKGASLDITSLPSAEIRFVVGNTHEGYDRRWWVRRDHWRSMHHHLGVFESTPISNVMDNVADWTFEVTIPMVDIYVLDKRPHVLAELFLVSPPLTLPVNQVVCSYTVIIETV